jgi:sigma-B regulation protein RsbU (phosphoserine phosphatase)
MKPAGSMVMAAATLPNDATHEVLIGEDQPHVSEALRLLLKGEGYRTAEARSPGAILDAVGSRRFDLALLDLNYSRDTTSGREGLELLARLHAIDPALPVVVMTAWGSTDLAVEAMRRGAFDFVQKPWDNQRLLEVVRAQVAQGRVRPAPLGAHEAADALEIQRGLLPATIPQLPGYRVAAAWQPARFVGGDLFDVLPYGEGRLAFCIADVAGKGLPAALLMSHLHASLRATAAFRPEPSELCRRLDGLLRPALPGHRFVTLFFGVLDGDRLTYANAGHEPPVLLRADGAAQRLTLGGPVLGIAGGGPFAQGSVTLCAGDSLLLWTDGVTDAMHAEGEYFGFRRLMRALRDASAGGADAIVKRVLRAVTGFAGQAQDDVTLLAVVRDHTH